MFLLFFWVIYVCLHLNPDPDPQARSGSRYPIESGSETLVITQTFAFAAEYSVAQLCRLLVKQSLFHHVA